MEIAVALLGVILLLVPFGGERWLAGWASLLLGIAAAAAAGLVAWFWSPVESRVLADGVAIAVINNVRVAPEVAALTLLGIALAGLSFARRRKSAE